MDIYDCIIRALYMWFFSGNQSNGEQPISYADAWDLATTIGAKYIETSSATQVSLGGPIPHFFKGYGVFLKMFDRRIYIFFNK